MPSKKNILHRLREIEKSIEVLKNDIAEHYGEDCFFNKKEIKQYGRNYEYDKTEWERKRERIKELENENKMLRKMLKNLEKPLLKLGIKIDKLGKVI